MSAQPTSVGGLIQQIPVVGTAIKPCPPVGFDSLPDFNLTAYVSAPWYIQQQVSLFSREAREREKEREREGDRERGKKNETAKESSARSFVSSNFNTRPQVPFLLFPLFLHPRIRKQIPVVYQPVNQLYCVRAVYKPRDPANFKKVRWRFFFSASSRSLSLSLSLEIFEE